jgi:tRNA nucleotidyltransferase (CCA-adding enzyme)
MLRDQEGDSFYKEFLEHLEKSLVPATRARDIMTRNVFTIHETSTIMDASIYMEQVNHTGLPVINDQGKLSGFLSLRDIMKARRVSQMHAPVSAYMSKNIISSDPEITMREVERLFYKNHIGHLPILEGEILAGIVTRWDFLEYQTGRKEDGMEETKRNEE